MFWKGSGLTKGLEELRVGCDITASRPKVANFGVKYNTQDSLHLKQRVSLHSSECSKQCHLIFCTHGNGYFSRKWLFLLPWLGSYSQYCDPLVVALPTP